jgi:GNAT superfamily N-acetyltransferase
VIVSSTADAAADVFQAHRDELGFVNRAQCREGDLLTIRRGGDVAAALLGNHCVQKPQSTVYELAVRPAYRREGLATELVDRFAAESPHDRLVAKCPTDLDANEFYRATGWQLTGTEDGKKRPLNVWRYTVTDAPDRITTGRPDLTAIATEYGWLQGSRVDYLDRYETRRYSVDFVDPGPDNCDSDRLVDVARRHAPRYVIAGDYEGDNQAEINDLADRLRPYAHRVIVVPHEPGEVERVPDWATVGYSSPTQYAGTDAPIWEYRGRDVHVLGGTIEQSIEIQRHLGDDVISFDCNSFHRSATQFAKWWGASSPHWNRLPAVADADSAETAYRNTMLNVSYELREQGIAHNRQTDNDHKT